MSDAGDEFPHLGLLMGQLCLRLYEPDMVTGNRAMEGIYVLYFLMRRRQAVKIPEIVDKIYMQLGSTYQFQGRQIMLKVVSVLAQTYMKDVCDALLQCPLPIDRYSTEMWHVMTKTFSEDELIALVHVLLNRLQMNPKITGNYMTPLAASSAFCKLFSVPRCADVALFIYPRLLMTLLVQVHYNIKCSTIWTMISEEDCEPVRYHMKTLKTLFLAVKAYIEFAFVESDGEMLTSCEDHHRGVGLLARSMLENCSCDLLRILYLLVPFLERGDEEHQITALAFFVEDIKVLLPTMTTGLSQMDGRLFVETVVDIEKILTSPEGEDCIGDISLSLQELFSNEKEIVRASAIYLFGKMMKLAKKSNSASMRSQAFDSLVPLLLHLQEENSDITKAHECMNFLGWKLPKQVVSDKAWYEHEEVLDETCKYLVKKQEGNLQRFLYQGLYYSESKLIAVKRASIMFLGFLIRHMDHRAQKMDLTLVGRALESLIHDKEETVCIAAARAHERVRTVLSKQGNGSSGGSTTAIQHNSNTNDKSVRNSHSTTAIRNSGSSHFLGILGLWRSGAGK
ncbi:hypothetical protein lerEdw1_011725 [Lerista edwardsae]|nr:hypothetical protein lerEdw1_011725 [Lerista edwardsae]